MSMASAESGWSSLGGRSEVSCEVIAVWELDGGKCFSLEPNTAERHGELKFCVASEGG